MRWLILVFSLFCAPAMAQSQTIDFKTLRALQSAQQAQQQGELDKAARILAGVQAEPGSYAQALVWRTEGYLVWQKNHNAHAFDLLQKAYGSGQLDEQQMLEDALALASLSLQLDKPQQALEYLQQTSQSRQQLELSIYAWQLLGRYDKALPLAEKYLAGQTDISEQWLGFMVAANAELKRYAKAQQWQKKLLALHPQQVLQWRQLAGIQQLAGEYQQAFATLRTAYQQELAFSDADLDMLVALASAAQQPWQGAQLLGSLMQQGRLASTAARQERLARLQWQARERGEALQQYQALAQQSDQAAHWLMVVQLASEQEDWSLARQALQSAASSGASRKQVRSWQDWIEQSAQVN